MSDTEKKYELRTLVAADMGAICKIVTDIGIRELKGCFDVSDLKGSEAEQIGLDIFLDVAGIVIANIPRAEDDINNFLASLTGKKVTDIKRMNLADYGELIIDVVTKREFRDFFERVMKLLKR